MLKYTLQKLIFEALY